MCSSDLMQLVGRTEAVLSGVRAPWNPPPETIPNLWTDGKMALPDFAHFAFYLARSSAREGEVPGSVQATTPNAVKAHGGSNA